MFIKHFTFLDDKIKKIYLMPSDYKIFFKEAREAQQHWMLYIIEWDWIWTQVFNGVFKQCQDWKIIDSQNFVSNINQLVMHKILISKDFSLNSINQT